LSIADAGARAGPRCPVAPKSQQFFLPNGTPNAGGCLFFYTSGTSTPAPTYTDVNGTILNSNPVVLDSSGYATIYLANQEYRVQMLTAGGVNCATGSQVWEQDGVSAYQIINGTQTIIFSGVTSFPVGSPGEVLYRTDLGRICFFYSSWDCFPGDATIDTLTNKTISVPSNTISCTPNSAGLYLRDNGTQVECSVIQLADLPPNQYQVASNQSPGTVLNSLAILVNGGVTEATTSSLSGIYGICVASTGTTCGATGNATILVNGAAICNYDTSAVSLTGGDFVTNSTTTAGDCHDTGSTSCPAPSLGQVIGVVQISSNQTTVIAPGLCPPTFPRVVYSTATASTNVSIGNTTMVSSVAVNSTWRIGVYLDVTQVGMSCAGNSTVVFDVGFTDPNTSIASTGQVLTFTITTNGTLGTVNSSQAGTFGPAGVIRAKAGTQIYYSTTYSAGGSCAPAPDVQLFPILEQLSGN